MTRKAPAPPTSLSAWSASSGSSGASSQTPSDTKLVQPVVTARRDPLGHRADALAIARPDQPRHIQRTHPPPRLVTEPFHKRPQPRPANPPCPRSQIRARILPWAWLTNSYSDKVVLGCGARRPECRTPSPALVLCAPTVSASASFAQQVSEVSASFRRRYRGATGLFPPLNPTPWGGAVPIFDQSVIPCFAEVALSLSLDNWGLAGAAEQATCRSRAETPHRRSWDQRAIEQ